MENRFEVIGPTAAALANVEVITAEVEGDERALRLFLDGYKRRSSHTIRAYRKECSRFLLWLRAKRGSGDAHLPSVGVQDINEYVDFLAAPRPFSEDFLGAHGWDHQPFRKPLSKESASLCITVLHRLFAAMREMRGPKGQPYCLYNPVTLAHGALQGSRSAEEVEEALTEEEWNAVQEVIESLPRESERERRHYHRARWLMQLLYRAFLRREEAASLTMGSFEASPSGWSIRLVGKGSKRARIVATNKLMAELRTYRQSLGLPALPSPGEARPAVMAVTGKDKAVTGQAIYLVCKEIFARAADLLEPHNEVAAARLRQSSPHWMRHTGVSHSMEKGIDPRYVQAQARHSNLNVTAKYDHKRREAWRDAFESVT